MSDNDVKQELALKLLGPVAESAGTTLQNIWEFAFGGLNLFMKKKAFTRAKDFEAFQASFEQRVIDIPPEALKEPKISILGPTLEASKFYFEEDTLREMFAALAAATLDARKERNLHPSYPEIIKQMSPIDAKNLSLFSHQFPIVEYYKAPKSGKYKQTQLTNVFLGNKNETDLELQSQSISSLVRLGLIDVSYELYIMKDQFYEEFLTTPYFLRLQKEALVNGAEVAGITRGRAKITPLGKSFRSVCLE